MMASAKGQDLPCALCNIDMIIFIYIYIYSRAKPMLSAIGLYTIGPALKPYQKTHKGSEKMDQAIQLTQAEKQRNQKLQKAMAKVWLR